MSLINQNLTGPWHEENYYNIKRFVIFHFCSHDDATWNYLVEEKCPPELVFMYWHMFSLYPLGVLISYIWYLSFLLLKCFRTLAASSMYYTDYRQQKQLVAIGFFVFRKCAGRRGLSQWCWYNVLVVLKPLVSVHLIEKKNPSHINFFLYLQCYSCR